MHQSNNEGSKEVVFEKEKFSYQHNPCILWLNR